MYLLNFQCFGQKIATKTVKMTGKTSIHTFPSAWWPFTPTSTIISSLSATGTIPITELAVSDGSHARTIESIPYLRFKITPTKFVDFTKSKGYQQLWKRTHRGIHWLPPRPTT